MGPRYWKSLIPIELGIHLIKMSEMIKLVCDNLVSQMCSPQNWHLVKSFMTTITVPTKEGDGLPTSSGGGPHGFDQGISIIQLVQNQLSLVIIPINIILLIHHGFDCNQPPKGLKRTECTTDVSLNFFIDLKSQWCNFGIFAPGTSF